VLEELQVHGPAAELQKVNQQLIDLPNVRVFENEKRFPRLGDYEYMTPRRLS
jgi:hypothetical protein